MQFFPEEGIHIFANGLHTHEVGKLYATYIIIISTRDGLSINSNYTCRNFETELHARATCIPLGIRNNAITIHCLLHVRSWTEFPAHPLQL